MSNSPLLTVNDFKAAIEFMTLEERRDAYKFACKKADIVGEKDGYGDAFMAWEMLAVDLCTMIHEE